MSPRGKQVSFRDIRGGVRTADDPRRTPARYFREIINAEYDIRGRLVKSKGYSVAQFAPTGHVRDIKRLRDNSNNTIGYLVGSDRLYRTDSITAPVTSTDLGSCASRIWPNYSGSYYFLSDNLAGDRALSKIQIDGANSIAGLAGIQPPSETSLVLTKHLAATSLWRYNGFRTWPGGTPYNANVLSLTGSPTPINATQQAVIVSGASSGYNVVNPQYSVDPGFPITIYTTWAEFSPVSANALFVWKADPTLFISSAWNANDPNYLTNTSNSYYNPANGTFRAPPNVTRIQLSFAFEGDIGVYVGWTAPQPGNPYPSNYTINPVGRPTRAPTRFVMDIPAGYWPYFCVTSSNGVGSGRVYDISLTYTYTSVSSFFAYTMKSHPGLVEQETFNRVAFFLRANNLTGTRSFNIEVSQTDNTDGSFRSEVRAVNIVGGARPDLVIDSGALTNTYIFDGTGRYTTKVKLTPSVTVPGDSVTLAPSYDYFNLGEGAMEYAGPSPDSVPPQMALMLTRTWPAGLYQYSAEFQDYQGFRSNYTTPVKSMIMAANDTVGISLLPIQNELTTKPTNKTYIIGRTLVGGGTMYQIKEITQSLLTSLIHSDVATWPMPLGGTAILPSVLLDLRPIPSGILLDTDLTPPTSLNFVEDSIKIFRRRLWGIVKIPDALGTIRTFLRYSDVEGFDYWNPLNELSLQDDLIEIQPFRDDVLLAFSASKVYRIIPVGDQFTYEKISDTGIGGIGMSVATHELVLWYNIHGAWVFDGAQVIKLSESEGIIEQIREMVEVGGRVWSLKREDQIWFCHTIPGGYNRSIILSTLFKNFVFRHSLDEIVSIIEEDGLLTSTAYYGLDGAIGIRNSTYLDRTTPIVSTIRTKRFCSRDVNDLRLQYMAWNRRNEASGSFRFDIIFRNGRTITKNRSLTGSEALMPYQDWFEVYGTDSWFEILITHTTNSPFEILDYTIGAYPIDLAFDAAGGVKESDSGA